MDDTFQVWTISLDSPNNRFVQASRNDYWIRIRLNNEWKSLYRSVQRCKISESFSHIFESSSVHLNGLWVKTELTGAASGTYSRNQLNVPMKLFNCFLVLGWGKSKIADTRELAWHKFLHHRWDSPSRQVQFLQCDTSWKKLLSHTSRLSKTSSKWTKCSS